MWATITCNCSNGKATPSDIRNKFLVKAIMCACVGNVCVVCVHICMQSSSNQIFYGQITGYRMSIG